MNAAELLEQAKRLGATFSVPEPDHIHVVAPEPLPDELMAAIKQVKPEVLAILTQPPDFKITACICEKPIGATGSDRCEVCELPLLCPDCKKCRGCKLALRYGWSGRWK